MHAPTLILKSAFDVGNKLYRTDKSNNVTLKCLSLNTITGKIHARSMLSFSDMAVRVQWPDAGLARTTSRHTGLAKHYSVLTVSLGCLKTPQSTTATARGRCFTRYAHRRWIVTRRRTDLKECLRLLFDVIKKSRNKSKRYNPYWI